MTKSIRVAVTLCATLAATVALAQSSAQRSFNQLKSLTGSWEGKSADGHALEVSFRDTAGVNLSSSRLGL